MADKARGIVAHDVFISYSSVDKAIADAMCHYLEQDGIRCWIAPRDVRPGQEYAAEIIDALAASRACVLIFSTHANESRHVKSEVERAVSHGIPVIPFRTQDVQPNKSMELFLGGRHWLDAISPPIEVHFQKLAHHLKFLVTEGAATATATVPAAAAGQAAGVAGAGPPKPSLGRSSWKLLPVAAALLLLAGLGAATAVFFLSRGKDLPPLPAAKSTGETPLLTQDARTRGAGTERVAASAESPLATQVARRPAAGTERVATAPVLAGTGRALKAVAVKGEIEVDLGGGVKMELVPIPAGEFMMGSPGDSGNFDERPQHLVRITKPFYLGKYKVTQEQWAAVTENNPSYFKGPQNPVEQVSWEACQTFIAWLNGKFAPAGKKFALPTEAQWEYACRAGSTTKYCFGDDVSHLGDYAWYSKNSDGHSHPVGEKKPNAWGLYDMHGNVWEWCQDWYDDGYYAKSPTDDPTGPMTGLFLRVYRGSGWASSPRDCRSAARRHNIPGHGYRYLGLRVALVSAASVSAPKRPSPSEAPLPKEHGPSGAAAARNMPGVEGTIWRFPAAAGHTTTSTIEFLDGGRFRWNGKSGEGFWKQDGNRITINVNDFTLFRLTIIDGDTMRGTWERLGGNDAGQKHTSVLRRATG